MYLFPIPVKLLLPSSTCYHCEKKISNTKDRTINSKMIKSYAFIYFMQYKGIN